MRAILLMCLLAVAAGLVTTGVALVYPPVAFIVGGFEVAGLAFFGLADTKADSR